MLRNLINDESGFLVSAELVLVFTLVFCAVAVGIGVVKDSLAQELGDVSNAIGALDQSFNFGSLSAPADGVNHATCGGSGFNDAGDECDCQAITIVQVDGKDDPSTLTGAGTDGTNP